MRYPPQPLEEKLAWMRERMEAKSEAEFAEPKAYFTVQEIANELRVSYPKALDLVKGEPGVLNLAGGKRRCLRVPRAVLERLVRRMSA